MPSDAFCLSLQIWVMPSGDSFSKPSLKRCGIALSSGKPQPLLRLPLIPLDAEPLPVLAAGVPCQNSAMLSGRR